jgi:hypothetical protein
MAKPKRRPPAGIADYDRNVFINCPFDPQYQPLFRALVFAIEDCGFLARCALEVEDSGEVRVSKILKIIKGCAFGIHDISRTETNLEGLPRFNMPYELGLFVGCTVFGAGPHKNKKALILDRERYRYAKYISDIAGQDIQDHSNEVGQLIKKVRNWLASHSPGAHIPGGDTIIKRFNDFCADLPEICTERQLAQADLDNYRDLHNCITEWLIANGRSAS